MNYQTLLNNLTQLGLRVRTVPRKEMIVELAILFVAVYLFLRYLRGTRGARGIKGIALILIVTTLLVRMLTGENMLATEKHYERLSLLYDNFLWFAGLAMMIVFQPELRRLLMRLGEARIFRLWRPSTARVVEPIVKAVESLSGRKVGSLIALERDIELKGVVDTGVALDAEVSEELLLTIFHPGSALHDMGVVIQDGRLIAASVQFPLAEGGHFGTELGSRHRAALGLSQETDALVVVVSEETGTISLAERGHLSRHLTPEQLREQLVRGLGRHRGATPVAVNVTPPVKRPVAPAPAGHS